MFNNKILEQMVFISSVIFFTIIVAIVDNEAIRYFSLLIIFILIATFLKYSQKETELKTLSVKYRDNQQLLSEIFKYCPDLIFNKDCNFKYICCNDAFKKVTGKDLENTIGKNDFELFSENVAKEARKNDKLIIQNKEIINYDQTITIPSGEIRTFNIIKAPLLLKSGKVSGILGIGRDTTTQNVLKTEIEEKQLQLSAILDNMPFFVCMKNLNGKIVRTNKQSVELHGLEPENMIGLNAKDLFPQEIAEEFLNDDKKVIENKEIIVKEIQFNTPSGVKWIESNRRPILDDDGNVQGIIIINKDINLIKEVAAQKETFVATLTHDLKVPTIAQIKALEVILNGSVGKLPQEQSEVLGQILNSCRYMLNMISTLLSTYRYEDGIKKINYEEFNFVNLVSECCNEIACLAKEKEQTITIKNNSVENLICADKLEIKRVITNLIANAISYSRKNSPIEISMEDSSQETIFLVNSYNKTIPKAQLEKLFDKYVSDASKYKKSGIGLGLYLTKQIVTAHNGEVIAESDEINGNTFGFKIPKTNLKTIISEELSNSVAQNNF